jgi:hypothetical protein
MKFVWKMASSWIVLQSIVVLSKLIVVALDYGKAITLIFDTEVL